MFLRARCLRPPCLGLSNTQVRLAKFCQCRSGGGRMGRGKVGPWVDRPRKGGDARIRHLSMDPIYQHRVRITLSMALKSCYAFSINQFLTWQRQKQKAIRSSFLRKALRPGWYDVGKKQRNVKLLAEPPKAIQEPTESQSIIHVPCERPKETLFPPS